MALRVPTVDGPSVAAQGLPSARQSSLASPGLLANDQLGQAGRALEQIGGVIQERTDADQVMRAETELKNQYVQFESEAKQRVGQQAWGVAKDAAKWFDDNAGKIGGDLSNPRQQFLYNQTVQKLRTQSLGTFSDFEADQRRQSLDHSAQASIVGSVNLAAANPQNPEVIASAKADVISRNRARAQINGWTPEMADAAEVNYLTDFHKQVIQSLARDYPDRAAAYFEANKGEIAGSQQAEIGHFAATATATRLGETTADAAWQQFGPKSDRDPVQLDVLEAKIRETLGTQDAARKAAITAVRERAAAFKDSRKERDDQTEASVNTAILQGASVTQVQRMPEFMQLDGEKQRKLVDFMEARNLRKTQQAVASDARAQQVLTRQGMGAYLAYSNPDTLAGMSENQVLNLLPTLGNELTNHLMVQKRALANPVKLAEAKMDEDDFKHIGRQMQLPVDEKASPDQKELMGELKYRVEQRIAAVQQQNGKPLARDQKMDLMRQEMARTVSVSTWLGLSSQDVPVIALTPDQAAKVSIPAADRRQISDAMRTMYQRTGNKAYEPTEDNLRHFYLLHQSPAADMILPKK